MQIPLLETKIPRPWPLTNMSRRRNHQLTHNRGMNRATGGWWVVGQRLDACMQKNSVVKSKKEEEEKEQER